MTNKDILTKAMQKATKEKWDGFEYYWMQQDDLWKWLPGFEGMYAVHAYGFVLDKRKVLKNYLDDRGYWRVTLNYKEDGDWVSRYRLLHRLIAAAWIPNPKKLPIVHHIDGDPLNNKLDNLKWVTSSENVKDGFDRGRQAWNKSIKSTATMNLEDLARELPRLQKECKALWGEEREVPSGKYKTQTLSQYGIHTKSEVLEGDYQFTEADILAVDGGSTVNNSGWTLTAVTELKRGWQYHLQQMVIADDPIKYLGENA